MRKGSLFCARSLFGNDDSAPKAGTRVANLSSSRRRLKPASKSELNVMRTLDDKKTVTQPNKVAENKGQSAFALVKKLKTIWKNPSLLKRQPPRRCAFVC